MKYIVIFAIMLFAQNAGAQDSIRTNHVLECLERMTPKRANELIDSGYVYILQNGLQLVRQGDQHTAEHLCNDSVSPKFGFKYLGAWACETSVEMIEGYNIYNAEAVKHLNGIDSLWNEKHSKEFQACISNQRKILLLDKNFEFENCQITFKRMTKFEIYDSFGELIEKGFAETADISTYKKGIYNVVYDNAVDKIYKPKRCK
jgi:hypothetical protein